MRHKLLSIGFTYAVMSVGLVVLAAGCSTGAEVPGGEGGGLGGGGDGGFDLFQEAGSSSFGATQGGVQDMGLARELIDADRVPPPGAFVVEGMFSEHELGLSGELCERALCLRAALGVAPTLGGTASGWLQLGLSSSIDPDEFERPSVTLIATVDVSGSMGWAYGTAESTDPTPGEVTRNLLSAIAAELDSQDQIAIVTYGSTVETVLRLTGGDDQVNIQATIDALSTGGSTNMEGGMVQAYNLARESDAQTDEVRVMVFTDVQPNVGATTASEFEQLAEGGAESGIGLTVMAVGLGLGQEVLNAMSQIRGGNAFSLFDNEDVVELMEDDWPWLLSPLAYDMSVELTPSAGFFVAESFGFPTGADEEIPGLDVSTIFLSRRKGALLARLTPDQGEDLTGLQVAGRLTYTTPSGALVEEDIEVAYQGEALDDRGQYFEQPGVGKTVALALLVNAMHEAAEQYVEDADSAVATMRAARDRFADDAEALDDEALSAEVQFASDLLELMEQGAEQGDLYGYASGS